MATDPGAAPRVLDRHRADDNGRCTGCARPTSWPCTLVAVARAAVVAAEELRSRATIPVHEAEGPPRRGSGAVR